MSSQRRITPFASQIHAVVALGSNLGYGALAPAALVEAAVERLQTLSASPVQCSRHLLTKPEGLPPGAPDFCNAVAVFEPLDTLDAHALLDRLLSIEEEFGRLRPAELSGARYASRTLDLDLICCRGERVDSPRLQLPHPRAAQRRFVLEPLAELWPDLVLPGASASVASLLAAL